MFKQIIYLVHFQELFPKLLFLLQELLLLQNFRQKKSTLFQVLVYMKKVGEGNPFDAYNHELAPRTKHLMTDGPYRFSRNPMLLGVYIYYIGVIIWLLKCWPLVVFAFIVVLLTLQVRSEEKRLEADFGEEYRVYREKVPRYLFRL